MEVIALRDDSDGSKGGGNVSREVGMAGVR